MEKQIDRFWLRAEGSDFCFHWDRIVRENYEDSLGKFPSVFGPKWVPGRSPLSELTSRINLGSWRYAANSRQLLAAAFVSRRTGQMNQEDKFGDQIRIEQLEVFARIGVPDYERSQPQRLAISITFWPIEQGRELGDDIARAVNYASVCTETKKFVQGRSDRLIETLADALASHLLGVFKIRRVTIELRKFILPDVKYVSVTVMRDRSTP